MGLTTEQMILVEQRVTNDGPSSGVAWLLLIFLGGLGAHRFYLGRTVTGFLMLITLGGLFFWIFVDLFLLSGMVRARRAEIRNKLTQTLTNSAAATPA